MPRSFSLLASALLAMSALSAGFLASASPVAAATVIAATTTCNNSTDNTPGLGAKCEVTIENTITAGGGGSATVTVRECHGAAGDPEASCATTITVLTEPVTQVTQCNDSMNGGGGTLRCSVQVTNTYVEDPSAGDVTVNQCVGSGDSIANTCDPFPATTSGATVTQCNGSANGGTLVELTCTATGTQSDAFSVEINQCNGSTNGGGALVICSANIDSVFAPAPTPTPRPTTTPSASPAPSATPAPGTTAKPFAEQTPRATQPPTDAAPASTSSHGSDSPLVLLIVLVVAGIAASAVRQTRDHGPRA